MRESLESLGAFIKLTGGLGLLVIYPLIPLLLAYSLFMAVGRGLWSKGTEFRLKPPERCAIDTYLRHD